MYKGKCRNRLFFYFLKIGLTTKLVWSIIFCYYSMKTKRLTRTLERHMCIKKRIILANVSILFYNMNFNAEKRKSPSPRIKLILRKRYGGGKKYQERKDMYTLVFKK